MKKIYLLVQNFNNGYDTYDSCIVCATSEQEAKEITPCGYDINDKYIQEVWATLENIECTELGTANEDTELGLILASFNAG